MKNKKYYLFCNFNENKIPKWHPYLWHLVFNINNQLYLKDPWYRWNTAKVGAKYNVVKKSDTTLMLTLPDMSFEKRPGHVDGIGKVSLLTATPYATPSVSIPLYGVSPVNSSHNTTP